VCVISSTKRRRTSAIHKTNHTHHSYWQCVPHSHQRSECGRSKEQFLKLRVKLFPKTYSSGVHVRALGSVRLVVKEVARENAVLTPRKRVNRPTVAAPERRVGDVVGVNGDVCAEGIFLRHGPHDCHGGVPAHSVACG
jgi:hypothetical protein